LRRLASGRFAKGRLSHCKRRQTGLQKAVFCKLKDGLLQAMTKLAVCQEVTAGTTKSARTTGGRPLPGKPAAARQTEFYPAKKRKVRGKAVYLHLNVG